MSINSQMTALADAIRKKSGKTGSLSIAGMTSAVNGIEVGGGGSSAVIEPSDVNFYDYDGELVASYTEAEAAAITELPTPPAHDGLAFQGWNYTLEEVISNADACDVGALYTTDDGKTRLHIRLLDDDCLTVKLAMRQTKAAGVVIDWGDGSDEARTQGASGAIYEEHEYTATGEYVITLDVDTDCKLTLGYGVQGKPLIGGPGIVELQDSGTASVYTKQLLDVQIGDRVTDIAFDAFDGCFNMKSISLGECVSYIGRSAFYNCKSLMFVTIPRGISTLFDITFYSCESLENVSIPPTISTLNVNFFECASLMRLVSCIDGSNACSSSAFTRCSSLKSVIIKRGSVTFNQSMFSGCMQLREFVCGSTGTVELNNSMFSGCGIQEIVIGDSFSLKSGASGVFNACKGLIHARFGTGVTAIGYGMLRDCSALVRTIFDGDISSIDSYAFYGCYSLKRLDLSNCTAVPTLSASYALGNVRADIEILVPAALAEEWKAATNWTAYADNIKGV